MPTRHAISSADENYLGGVFTPLYNNEQNTGSRRGILMNAVAFFHSFGAVATIVTTSAVASATSTELPNAETVTYTTADDNVSPIDSASRGTVTTITDSTGVSRSVWPIATPRCLTATMTHGTSIVATTIVVTGFDVYKQLMSELFTITATGTSKTVVGGKAFAYILSIAITSASDSEANTLVLGFNDKLGLPFAVDVKNKIIGMMDGAMDTPTIVLADTTSPATTATTDVRGTVDFATASNGTRIFAAWLIPASRSDVAAAFGVAQV